VPSAEGRTQAMLVVLNAAADPDSRQVVIDPNAIDAGGRTTIDWVRPSADGALVAASLSQNGSEIGTLHVYETETGKEIGEPIPRVQAPTAGGNATWLSDNSGFWYTRYPGEERPEADRFFYQQVYFHKLGTDWQKDPLVLGTKDGLPRVAEIFLGSENSRDLRSVCRGIEIHAVVCPLGSFNIWRIHYCKGWRPNRHWFFRAAACLARGRLARGVHSPLVSNPTWWWGPQ
jgi:hypothetical protein